MEEVKVENLEKGKDYFIQMVGRYLNEHRKSGKGIAINFIKTLTFGELERMPNLFDFEFGGIHPGSFDNDDLFVQFEKVIPVNPESHECGICHYTYYPPIPPSWDNLTEEQKTMSRGGYRFFKRKKQEKKTREDKQAHKGLNTLMSNKLTINGGKTRRRNIRRRRKINTKTRKKAKTKRKKTNAKYSQV
jgi:hypothetical protein